MNSIICPRCNTYCQGDCAPKKLSRRFFFGLLGGTAAAMALPSVWENKRVNPFTEDLARAIKTFNDPTVLRRGDVLTVNFSSSVSQLPLSPILTVETEKKYKRTKLVGTKLVEEFAPAKYKVCFDKAFIAPEAMRITGVTWNSAESFVRKLDKSMITVVRGDPTLPPRPEVLVPDEEGAKHMVEFGVDRMIPDKTVYDLKGTADSRKIYSNIFDNLKT